MSASGRGPASASSSAIGKPVQVALPARLPPTSLDTQVRVTIRSRNSRLVSDCQSSSISLSTIPWIRSRQSAVVSAGTRSAVSMR